MNKRTLLGASILALLAIVFTFGIAFAHEHVPVGNYELVIGWAAEPPVAGQLNAITIEVSDTTSPEKEVDISNLTATLAYGGQTKPLTLEKSFGTTNEYEAHIIPAIAGQYTLQLRGTLGDTEVNVDVEPEEVSSPDTLVFPNTSGTQAQQNGGFTVTDWLAGSALVIALAGLIVGLVALRKTR
jgi:hypothetical protein